MNTHLERGFAAIKARNITEAAQCFEMACRESPQNHMARAWLGQSLCNLGRRNEGLPHLVEAGKGFLDEARKTKNLNIVFEIAGQLQHWNDFTGALQILDEAVRISPAEFRGQQMLAVTFAQLNKKSEAIEAAEAALHLAPGNQMMQVFLGSLEADAGKSDKARERFEKLLETKPEPREAFRAHKELARVLDRLGRFEQVFSHLNAAATLSKELPEYARQDATLIPRMIESNRLKLNRKLLGRWAEAKFPPDSPPPNFIVGFMRSGTTLTQEVLAAHPEVFVADEIGFVSDLRDELNEMDKSDNSTATKIERLDWAGLLHLRSFYWQKVRDRFGDEISGRVFVDKFTMNVIDIGLINCVFPDAKVIFVNRDPRDVCLSCFMQLMVPTPTTVQLLTWEGAARFYALVMSWWEYIKAQMTMQVCEFHYEDAVNDFEATYRRILEFLGLGWDDALWEFHKRAAQKFVASPSRAQVTQPLYASSVARWRRYEQDFAPVMPYLQPFIDKLGYAVGHAEHPAI